MKMIKNIGLISLGAAGVILYQKYNPMMMEALKDKIICACEEVEDML